MTTPIQEIECLRQLVMNLEKEVHEQQLYIDTLEEELHDARVDSAYYEDSAKDAWDLILELEHKQNEKGDE